MTSDERIAHEGAIDVEMGKVLYVVESKIATEDEDAREREVLAEIIGCLVRVRGRGPATLLTIGDLVAQAIEEHTPTGPAH